MMVKNPRAAFKGSAVIMVRGKVLDASLISSAMVANLSTRPRKAGIAKDHNLPICTTLSMPAIDAVRGVSPTMNDIPLLAHPPLFVNSVKTACAGFFDESTQSGMAMQKIPQT